MPRVVHMTVGAIMLWAIGSAPAGAFQEMPTAPAPSLTAPQLIDQGLTFDVEQAGNDSGNLRKNDKGKLPGFGALGGLPKMNFGLELLYGAPEEHDTAAPALTDLGADDLKVLGKIKRRF